MIIVKIYGGLGNQIFQFIFGKYLEQLTKQDVYYDFYYFNKYSFRKPSLYKCVSNIKTLNNIKLHQKFNRFDSFQLNKIFNKISYYNSYFDDQSSTTKKIFSTLKDYYFDGYWQSSIYFKNIINTTDFLFIDKFISTKLIPEIAIHVRRGDYLINPNNKIWHVQNIEYYSSAINFILNNYGSKYSFSKISVYTDDVVWVRQNFKFELKVEILNNDDYIDLFQLSNFQFLITSNSTFSISAALINKADFKTVIVPKKWFLDEAKNSSLIDSLYLNEWVII